MPTKKELQEHIEFLKTLGASRLDISFKRKQEIRVLTNEIEELKKENKVLHTLLPTEFVVRGNCICKERFKDCWCDVCDTNKWIEGVGEHGSGLWCNVCDDYEWICGECKNCLKCGNSVS